MTTLLPRDVSDLYLAPVVLALDTQIQEYSALSVEELARRVALASDLPDDTAGLRSRALLRTLAHVVDLHEFTLAWDPRGVRVTHGDYSLVLGIPDTFRSYLSGAE
jgi:hypothetical protein